MSLKFGMALLGFFFFCSSAAFANLNPTIPEWLTQIDVFKKENTELRSQLTGKNPLIENEVKESPAKIPQAKWRNKKSKAGKGLLDFNVYYDVEKYSVFTLNAGAKLQYQFSYFSLTNYSNSLNADDPLRDHDAFHAEQNIRWHLPEENPFELTAQWTLRSGAKNDSLRLETRWVAEDSLGLQLIDNLYVVAENRYIGFRCKDRRTLGLGLEYIIPT